MAKHIEQLEMYALATPHQQSLLNALHLKPDYEDRTPYNPSKFNTSFILWNCQKMLISLKGKANDALANISFLFFFLFKSHIFHKGVFYIMMMT